MSLTRRKFIKASVVMACATLPLKSVLGQSSLGQMRPSSSSNVNPDQLGYYSESSFTPYLNTQFRVYLTQTDTRGLKLVEVSDYLSTLPVSVLQGSNSPQNAECFSLLLTIAPGRSFDQDTYLIEHDALGSFYMFVVPVGKRGKAALDYYEAVFYRHPQLPQGYETVLSGVAAKDKQLPTGRDGEVYYFRPKPPAPVQAEDKGAAGRLAAARLSMTQFTEISGIKLGMTVAQVLALFPGSRDDAEVRDSLAVPPSPLGVQGLSIRPWKYSPGKKFDGVTQIVFTFLDGRVSSFYVGYAAPVWADVDQFISKFSAETQLPGADSWYAYDGMNTQLKTLKCKDFEISLFAGGDGVKLNYVQLSDTTAQQILNARRAKARATKP